MRSSLRRFHRLRELAQLARFIGRAPDTHAFQQLDVAQASLVASWRGLLQSGQILPFDAVGFQAYSENEEDGILLYIFTVAGTTNKTVVEISSQDGQEADPSFARAKSIVADEIGSRSKRRRPPNWVRSAKMMSRSPSDCSGVAVQSSIIATIWLRTFAHPEVQQRRSGFDRGVLSIIVTSVADNLWACQCLQAAPRKMRAAC